MTHTPSPELYNRIIAQINYEHKLQLAKRRFWLFLIISCVSLTFTIPLLSKVITEANNNGLSSIISLAWTDYGIVVIYAKEFIMSALEAIPFPALTKAGLPLALFFYSLAQLSDVVIEYAHIRQKLI
jgi:hypothetical protein